MVRAADAIADEHWSTSPREGCWSAAEVIAHVMTIERLVVATATRILRKQPKQIPILKRVHLTFAFLERRMVRLKTPIAVDPQFLCAKGAMLAELGEVRRHTLALIEETRDRDLSAYRWQHPFMGSLNAYEWLLLLGSHQIRHEKQMREIAADLSKQSAASEK